MTIWPQPDGAPIACNEKLKMLAENETELRSVMSDAFDDAVLMGVDPAAMRALLVEMVRTLPGPGSNGPGAPRTGLAASGEDGPDADVRGASGPGASGAPGLYDPTRPDGGRA